MSTERITFVDLLWDGENPYLEVYGRCSERKRDVDISCGLYGVTRQLALNYFHDDTSDRLFALILLDRMEEEPSEVGKDPKWHQEYAPMIVSFLRNLIG